MKYSATVSIGAQQFNSPLFGKVKVLQLHDWIRGWLNIIEIDGKEQIEVHPGQTKCYICTHMVSVPYRMSWKRLLNKLKYSNDINFKRRFYTLVSQVKQKHEVALKKAEQQWNNYNICDWTGVSLPRIVSRPKNIWQTLLFVFSKKMYNRLYTKKFPRIDKDFCTIQDIQKSSGLEFQITHIQSEAGLTDGVYGPELERMKKMLQQQAKQIIKEAQEKRK